MEANTTLQTDEKSARTTVRFSIDEYAKLLEDVKISGESIPHLLKNAYFKSRFVQTLMPPEERKALYGELRRIGNNVNQIARKVNSGLAEDWYPEFSEVTRSLNALADQIIKVYGHR